MSPNKPHRRQDEYNFDEAPRPIDPSQRRVLAPEVLQSAQSHDIKKARRRFNDHESGNANASQIRPA
jgi:hypothetical protein